MNLSDDLKWRGLIKDRTFEDESWLDKPHTFYHGVDASADSMTIGNLAAMMMARRLIEAGWQAILLAGGATSLIGDPKDTKERELQPREEIEKNVEAVKGQINQLFAGQQFTLVDNYDWFKDVGYLDFLREVGKNFAISELMQREFITERLQSGISYAEFSYSLIQGYDYWQLYNKHGTVLQIGGSDQWGNMLSGVALIRKKEAKEAHALSMPLVVDKSTGRKFGKSEAGAIWLDAKKTSPAQFYQFWINTGDDDVEDYLKIFTLLKREEIEELMKVQKAVPQERAAQTALASEVTRLVHGEEEVAKITALTDLFTGKLSIEDLTDEQAAYIRNQIKVPKLQAGTNIIEALVQTGLAASNSEARRIKEGGGVYINNASFKGDHLDAKDFSNGRLILRRGKAYKDSALIELA